MKIVVLTSETPGNVWLVNRLLEGQDVVGMVIERRLRALTKQEKFARRRQMLRRHGLARTCNKLVYNWVRSRFSSRSGAVADEQGFFPAGTPAAYRRQVPTVVVSSINDPAGIEFIRRCGPDLLAVCGTSVIREEVFALAPRGAVNIHTGITPEYRSADPIFWALYCGEPEKVGVTIHFVDRGIDTGPIIHQEKVPVYAGDTLATLNERCVRAGAELYLRALAEIEQGTVRTVERPGVVGKAFRSIDLGILQYLLFRRRFRRLAARLPRNDAAQAPRSPSTEAL